MASDGGDDDGVTVVTRKNITLPLAVPDSVSASLEVVRGEPAGKRFHLVTVKTTIGRDPEAMVHLEDPQISRTHVVITYQEHEFRIADQETPNGTLLNGSRVSEYRLHDGDTILIGDTLLRFSLEVKPLDP